MNKKIVAIGIETKNAKITYNSSLSFSKIFEKEDSLISEINILMIIIKKPTKSKNGLSFYCRNLAT